MNLLFVHQNLHTPCVRRRKITGSDPVGAGKSDMFGWLKWGKPAHPLADPDHVRKLTATLPGNDPARALEKISAWLDSITQTKALKLRERWQAVDLLDQATVARRRKLAQDYVTASRLEKVGEVQPWDASFGLWRALAAAYLRCIETVKVGGVGAGALGKGELAVVTGRVLRAAGSQLKWTYLRHGQADERIWRELGSAYLFAESQDIAGLRTELYSEEHGISSAQEELLKALMLVMASPYNLTPLKLHLAERFVAHFAGRFTLTETAAPQCSYSFDLVVAKPPAKARRQVAASSMLRFFGAGEAERALADLVQEVSTTGAVPREVNLGGHFDGEIVLSVLAHLARLWDSTPPARRAQRSELVAGVTVVPGLPNILRSLERVGDGSPPDPMQLAEHENWAVFDKSEGGYGVLAPEGRESLVVAPVTGIRTTEADWLRIGTLVALREERATGWRIGVVRRITCDASNQRRVGIEVLEGMALVVRLAPAGGARPDEPERRRSAVLLSPAKDQHDEVLVLMRAGHFTMAHDLGMHLADQRFLLRPAALVEAGEDFDCGRFRMMPA
jgi:hypothetical protein